MWLLYVIVRFVMMCSSQRSKWLTLLRPSREVGGVLVSVVALADEVVVADARVVIALAVPAARADVPPVVTSLTRRSPGCPLPSWAVS